jgi:hypothetical protein
LVILFPLHKNITPFEGLYYGIISWLEIMNLFQTFEDLESVKDKQIIIESICKVLQGEVSKIRRDSLAQFFGCAVGNLR